MAMASDLVKMSILSGFMAFFVTFVQPILPLIVEGQPTYAENFVGFFGVAFLSLITSMWVIRKIRSSGSEETV